MNIAILGDGAWGSATALHLASNKHEVILWGPFPEYISIMKDTQTNPKFLPKILFDNKISFTSSLEEALKKAEILVLALPSQYIRSLLTNIKPFFNNSKHILVDLAKGIENNTLMRMSEIVLEILGDSKYTVLSGPSHAEEVIFKVPTAVVAASKDQAVAKIVQDTFFSPSFRVYYSNDPIGVELGGALKNVFAIAAGAIDGIKLGDNSKAALITRSIAEMSRLGRALGGNPETFSGLSGIGDLIVTCFSKHSRNRLVGEKLGAGYSLEQILKELNMAVAEGVKTTLSAYQLAKKNNIQTPIIDELYKTLYKNKKPDNCIKDLMTRAAAAEIY